MQEACGDRPLALQPGMRVQGLHAGQCGDDGGAVARDWLEVCGEEVRLRRRDQRGASAPQPGAQCLPDGPQRAAAAILQEIDNGAVVGLAAHREVNPVLILPTGDHDFVAVVVVHDGGVPGARPAIEDITERSGVLTQVNVALERLQLLVHWPGPFKFFFLLSSSTMLWVFLAVGKKNGSEGA